MRDGEELVKEKAPEYIGRTNVMRDGSVMLSKVQPQDNGSYRFIKLIFSFLLHIAELNPTKNGVV